MEKRKVIYYQNELEDEFANDHIKPKSIDENYDYDGGTGRKIARFIIYDIIAKPIAFLYLKIFYGHRIINRNVIKEHLKKRTDRGFFLYGNHTNAGADALIPSMICMPKNVSVIVHPNNVSMPVFGHITPCLGAIPLPDDKKAMINFMNSVKKRVCDTKDCITIYPEAHIWPFYTHIRPFTDKSFGYPVKYATPVFCFTNTYQKRFFFGGTRMVTYVDGPFYPEDGISVVENRKKLRDKVYDIMVKRSGNNNIERIHYIKKDTEGTM
ncbi:MAG: hypothetical protein IJV15_01315 [Lachnospiraceae bacterium]|nr:hypothetical protein [Lachnospiraceae bacterium]